jgi:hypothetical protein
VNSYRSVSEEIDINVFRKTSFMSWKIKDQFALNIHDSKSRINVHGVSVQYGDIVKVYICYRQNWNPVKFGICLGRIGILILPGQNWDLTRDKFIQRK